jgi:HEAT repeat protein
VARLAPPEYPAELAALLDPPSSPGLRQAALQAYSVRRAAEDLPLFQKGLADADPAVRRVAVESLYIPESVGMLGIQYARDPSLEVRVSIVRQLGHVGSEDAATTLRSIAASAPEPSVREAAQLALAVAEE